MPGSIEALVAALAEDVLDSFEKLEVVVYLAEPRTATADELMAAVRFDRDVLAEVVEQLAAAGVIERTGDRLSIARQGPWARHCDALAALQRTDRMQVATLMSQAAVKRLRSKAARAFSDAFVLRPKKGGRDG